MDKKKSLWQKIKALKNKEIIIAVVSVVIMLVVYFSTLPPSAKSQTTQISSQNDYCAHFQVNLESAVKSMSGDNDASVVIRWSCSVEKQIAYTESETQNGSNRTPTLIQTQNGNEPIVLKEVYPLPQSVAVVVKNASDTKLKIDIMQMISTLLEIPIDKVAVYSSK